MAARMTRDGDTIRVEWPIRWFGRLPSLPLLAASLYLSYYVALGLRDDLVGPGRWRDDGAGILVFAALALAVGLPGLVMLSFRYFVELDKGLRQVVVTRQFGPLRFRSLRRLADFNLVSVTDDGDPPATTFDVNLCGAKGTRPIALSGFSDRGEADELARELGDALKLPYQDVVGTEPDADENQ